MSADFSEAQRTDMILIRPVRMSVQMSCMHFKFVACKMLPHSQKESWYMSFARPIGGSSEHHCEPGHSEGLCFQELQPASWGSFSLPGGLPAPALAGHPCNVSSPWVLPGVHLGK